MIEGIATTTGVMPMSLMMLLGPSPLLYLLLIVLLDLLVPLRDLLQVEPHLVVGASIITSAGTHIGGSDDDTTVGVVSLHCTDVSLRTISSLANSR
jgi:hypothetical protein